ncbi:sulfurtransferase TusA [Aliikangiella maris]|uniref:Sulfurtransferase TusA n=2 Tax=Aliikangiella maris TaxID=3162458 RepID=A0ABV3MP04_9GAMM
MSFKSNTKISLDTLGLKCPEPIMMIRKSMRKIDTGDILHIVADDPATKRDIPSFCEFMDHQLLEAQTDSSPFHYWIKKGEA